MEQGLRDEPGGILGLADFVREHGEAVEYDLLTHGFRLADLGTSLSWRDLRALVRRWGGLAGTATFRSVHGYEGWSIEAQLLAHLLDAEAVADYHRLKLGGVKSAHKPKPMRRPWERRATFGSGAIPYDEIDAWVASTWTHPEEETWPVSN